MLDEIKDIGFRYATFFGATIGMDDIVVPTEKPEMIEAANKQVDSIQNQYLAGHITQEERYNRVVEVWSKTNEELTAVMMKALERDRAGFNNIYMMANSGARGSRNQIRQLAGMRGLMAKPSGDIIELPIRSNFREGLSVIEFFISTNGARKGLADTALKTADAGYLTRSASSTSRRTSSSTRTTAAPSTAPSIRPSRTARRSSRPCASASSAATPSIPIRHPITGDLIVAANEEITEEIADKIDEAGIEEVTHPHGPHLRGQARRLPQVLRPQPRDRPHRRDRRGGGHHRRPVHRPAGHAAHDAHLPYRRRGDQGLRGEPHLPQVPRPRHRRRGHLRQDAGGPLPLHPQGRPPRLQDLHERRARARATRSSCRTASASSRATRSSRRPTRASPRRPTSPTPRSSPRPSTAPGRLLLIAQDQKIDVRNGSEVIVKPGDIVATNGTIATFDPFSDPIISEHDGYVRYEDIIPGSTLKEEINEETGNIEKKITEFAAERDAKQPRVVITDEAGNEIVTYFLPGGAYLNVEDGELVKAGRTLAKTLKESAKAMDITGGLPRVGELFEARKPKTPTVLATVAGVVAFRGIVKGKRVVVVKDIFNKEYKHLVPMGRRLLVRDGDTVEAGDLLCDGNKNPHDIMNILGEQYCQRFLMDEVQQVYRLQGVTINDKHIGVIIRQMMKKVEIVAPGDTKFIYGQQIDKYRFHEENKRVVQEGGQSAVARPLLLGITRASLKIDSFFAAASFQETTRVLTDAAIAGATDTPARPQGERHHRPPHPRGHGHAEATATSSSSTPRTRTSTPTGMRHTATSSSPTTRTRTSTPSSRKCSRSAAARRSFSPCPRSRKGPRTAPPSRRTRYSRTTRASSRSIHRRRERGSPKLSSCLREYLGLGTSY